MAGGAVALAEVAEQRPAAETARYRSPWCLAVSPEDGRVYVADRTGGCLVVLDGATLQKLSEIPLRGEPCGLCLTPDGRTAYVAERGAGSVAVVDTASSSVTSRIAVDQWPVALALAPQGKRLYVAAQDRHRVWAIDLTQAPGVPLAQIPVVREPSCLAVTPDERFVVATNLLPDGAGTDPTLAAVVSLLDTATLTQTATVRLPAGSTSVYGVCVSPDGRWAYVVHTLGRFNLPITQLERGWVNTYALSLIDVAGAQRLATLLLDDLTQGAANPFAVVGSADGSRLWISHAGTHEISFIDIGKVHELLGGKVPEALQQVKDGTLANIWVRIQQDRALINDLENDLTALYIAGAVRRVPAGGNGPRGLALSPDGTRLYVANYYAGEVAVLDASSGKRLGQAALGPQPPLAGVRRGEMLFHDATLAFQRWHSCAVLPSESRTRGRLALGFSPRRNWQRQGHDQSRVRR